MTYDMNLSFRPDAEDSLLSGTRVSLNIRNLTDKDPPIVLSGTNAVDTNAHNVFGRIWSIELAKSF
jgi:iron complex outermembrane receptor protein